MGFSCHLCRKPFQEKEQLSQKGGGDGNTSQYTASTTTCGHIFHTLCLKNFFDNSASKSGSESINCPVCNKALTNKDVIKVRAYPYDECFQRSGMEDLQNEIKHLRHELGLLENERKDLSGNNHELQINHENIKRKLDLMKLKYEQSYRLYKVQAADIENHKSEIEKLKNVIVKLTEELTVGGHQFVQSEVPKVHPNKMLNINGPQNKASNLSRPHGLMLSYYTLSSENVSGLSSLNSGHQLSQDMKRLSLGQPGVLAPTFSQALAQQTQQQECQFLERYRQQSEQGIPFKGGNKVKEGLGVAGNRSSTMADIFPNPLKHSQQNVNVDLVVASKESGGAAAGASGFQAPKTSGISQTAKGKDAPKDTDPANYDYDEFQDVKDHDDGNKWHEKRNRRPRSSKSGGSRSSASNNPRNDDMRYGYFKCGTCNASWRSSKCILNQPQVCRYCKTKVSPYKQDIILSRKQLERKQMEAASAKKKK